MTMFKRVLGFMYGVACYAAFFATFLYAIGFVGNFGVPKTLDSGPVGPLGTGLLIDAALLGLFALQHSVMARPAFKRAVRGVIADPIERSTYVLASSVAMVVLFRQWQPIGGVVWQLESPVGQALAYAVFAAGWLTVLVSTFLINHFDLFGLRQVWFYLRGRPYEPLTFRTPGAYKFVRHPIYVGWLLAFWATPTMTVAHLVFALATTGYILIAIQFEERDLVHAHPAYARYRSEVPMLVPRLARRQARLDAMKVGAAG
jgi:protein-S-isoprenylcysteine O-methyltransferase Ste14